MHKYLAHTSLHRVPAADESFTVIEHHPAQPPSLVRELLDERFARVTFEDWRIRRQWQGLHP
jgi:hypothetical protein